MAEKQHRWPDEGRCFRLATAAKIYLTIPLVKKRREKHHMSKVSRLWGVTLGLFGHKIAGTRAGKYWLNELSNHKSFQPLYDIMAYRVPASLRMLREAGYAPDIVVDIGAHNGDWTRMALLRFPEARFIMIEAQPDKGVLLKKVCACDPSRIDYTIGLLGAENRESIDFFLLGLGSSIYIENTAFPRERISLPMLTLDAVLGRYAAGGTSFLKLDVQGAELDVLAGASQTLERTDVILLEASLVEYNRGAPRIADVIVRMRELGFLLYDVCDLRRIGPVLAQTDLIFIRQGSALDEQAQRVIYNWGASS
jgi:FkbM family methyltransferase